LEEDSDCNKGFIKSGNCSILFVVDVDNNNNDDDDDDDAVFSSTS
jgi:hypothetical protein